MKVMCITPFTDWDRKVWETKPVHPEVGEICTVVNVSERGLYYYLDEYPNDIKYLASHFAPLSEEPEEVIEEKEPELQEA